MKVYDIYIAACEQSGGIYHYKKCGSDISFADKTDADRPMYFTVKDNVLYAILRAPFENSSESGIVQYNINRDGSLTLKEYAKSTHGECACHITVGEAVYAANYLSGSVVKMPDKVDVRTGSGPNKPRQDMAHVHYVNFSPDGKYIFAVDLGNDDIITYTKDLEEISSVKVPAGHGARHLAYHENKNTVFCVNELGSSVTVLKYNAGELNVLDTVSILPNDFSGENTSAAIRVRGDYVYVSNRGHDSISCLKYENDTLRLLSVTQCGGKGPRDFDFVGDDIIVTNQNSGNITIFNVNKEILTQTDTEFMAESPICIVYKESEHNA